MLIFRIQNKATGILQTCGLRTGQRVFCGPKLVDQSCVPVGILQTAKLRTSLGLYKVWAVMKLYFK